MARPPEHIVIVGGGSAGWMAASIFLASFGRQGSRISLVESSNVPTIGVGEGTTPLFKRFLKFLGIPEAEFMAACNATYKHGIEFPDWTANDEFPSYFHPFASPAFSQYDRPFFEACNRRRRGEAADTDPAGYFFAAELAAQRKAPAGPPPRTPDKIDYAYHFDAGLLAEFLKQRCRENGINHVIDHVNDVVLKENGDISHLVTEEGGELHGDFFVDCTGFARRLLGQRLGAEFTSYKPRLFNDSAVALRTPLPEEGDIPPYTESRALSAGWAWRIPLTNRIGWGYVHSSDYITSEEAERELRELIGAPAEDQPARHLKMQTGRVSEHWKNNCVSIGLSQGFIEPLEATALGLVQFSINRFVTQFARGNFEPTYRDHFNRIVNDAFDSTLDYIQMHYKLTTRRDTPYWRDCAANENISDVMRGVIEGWDSEAPDFLPVLQRHVQGSSYAPYSWYCILSGMGRYPAGAAVGQKAENPYRGEAGRYYGHREYLENQVGGPSGPTP